MAREALELAREIEDAGVEVVALALLGSALVASGAVEEGFRRLEECGALAISEEFVETAAPGWALCHTVSACADVGDFARAEQWCRALHAWSAVWRARHFFGVCRTAYGDVLAVGGDWSSAEQELLSALDDLRTTRPALAAPTAVRLGRLRVRQGDLVAARALFESALPLPQAVLALGELDLAVGDASSAADAADRVLRRLGDASVLDRFPALELLARARATAGDADGADAIGADLEQEATRLSTPYMRGRAHWCAHTCCRVPATTTALARSPRTPSTSSPAARHRTKPPRPGRCCPQRWRRSVATSGPRPRRRRRARRSCCSESEGDATAAATSELSPRETDILRLVAQGLGDAQIAERLFLSPHTVHRHVANIRAKLRVPSRAAAVAHAPRAGLL